MKLERRDLMFAASGLELEARADGDPARVNGYAARFHDSGDEGTEFVLWTREDGKTPAAVERIAPGAFSKVLAERGDVLALFNHAEDFLLGRTSAGTLRLRQTDRGLSYTVDLPETSVGRDVEESVRRGDLRGSSFSFLVEEDRWETNPENGLEIRTILVVGYLHDVGPVTSPAYASTSAALRSTNNPRAGIRAFAGTEDARAARDAWKAGIDSERAARAIRARKIRAESLVSASKLDAI